MMTSARVLFRPDAAACGSVSAKSPSPRASTASGMSSNQRIRRTGCSPDGSGARYAMMLAMPKPMDWQALLVDGYEPLKKAQRVFRRLPRDPRCKLCQNPFAGAGGKLMGLVGRKPSRKNPNLCQYCFDHLPAGGIEVDIGVVFADVRGSTTMGETATATEFARRLNRFYATATDVLVRHDGLIDKLIGDEVMGLFIRGLSGPEYRRNTALAALD